MQTHATKNIQNENAKVQYIQNMVSLDDDIVLKNDTGSFYIKGKLRGKNSEKIAKQDKINFTFYDIQNKDKIPVDEACTVINHDINEFEVQCIPEHNFSTVSDKVTSVKDAQLANTCIPTFWAFIVTCVSPVFAKARAPRVISTFSTGKSVKLVQFKNAPCSIISSDATSVSTVSKAVHPANANSGIVFILLDPRFTLTIPVFWCAK